LAAVSLHPILSPDGARLALLALNPAVPGANEPQLYAARRNMNLPPQFTTVGSHALADSSTTVSDSPTEGQSFSFTVAATDSPRRRQSSASAPWPRRVSTRRAPTA